MDTYLYKQPPLSGDGLTAEQQQAIAAAQAAAQSAQAAAADAQAEASGAAEDALDAQTAAQLAAATASAASAAAGVAASQVAGMSDALDAVQGVAQAATTASQGAQTTATAAEQSAATAQTVAASAEGAANAAQATASAVAGDASAAVSAATSAQTAATAASAAAVAAAAQVDGVAGSIASAQSAADAAQSAANNAQSTATSAQSAAQAAQTTANSAETAATAAQTAATSAADSASTAASVASALSDEVASAQATATSALNAASTASSDATDAAASAAQAAVDAAAVHGLQETVDTALATASAAAVSASEALSTANDAQADATAAADSAGQALAQIALHHDTPVVAEWESMIFAGAADLTPMAVPAYRVKTAEPRFDPSKLDVPNSATPIYLRRVSNAASMPQSSNGNDVNNWGPHYAFRRSWNQDNGKLMIYGYSVSSTGAYQISTAPNSLLLDGETGVFLAAVGGINDSSRWSQQSGETDLIIAAALSADPELMQCDVSNPGDAPVSVLRNFSAEGYTSSWWKICGDIGDQSADGRYWALNMAKGGQEYLFVWDRITDTLLSEKTISGMVGQSTIDGCGMTRSGSHYYLLASDPFTHDGNNYGRGFHLFDRLGNHVLSELKEFDGTSMLDHGSIAVDSAGNDVWIWYGAQTLGGARGINSFNLGTGLHRVEVSNQVIVGYQYQCGLADGYGICSDYPVNAGNDAANAFPYRSTAFFYRLDGSGELFPIAQARYRTTDGGTSGYYHFPWCTPSNPVGNNPPDQFMFRSAFGQGTAADHHAVIASK